MATEKIINTRIQLKYDTLANWNANSSLILKKGEVGICAIPTAPTTDPDKKLQVIPPAIMFKVGDGVTPFGTLNWASALAADVYAWAKKDVPDVTDFQDIIDAARKGLISADSVVKTLNNLKGDVTIINGDHTKVNTTVDNTIAVNLDLTPDESNALSSGITSTKVETYDGYSAKITAAQTKADKGVEDAAAAKKVADAALPSATFNEFKTTNTAAIADAKAAGTTAQSAAEAAQTTANAALPKTDFDEFKTTNTSAIAEAKKAGTDAATALDTYKTSNDAAVAANATAISNLQEAMKSGITFKGKVDSKPAVTNYVNGDLIIVGTKEYILYDNGTSKEWIELGDEGSHLTKTTADTYYVPLTRTIAGKKLEANISAADMRTALNVADGATNVIESTVSGWGFTKNKGTVTSIKMNGAAKTVATDGSVDLGTIITEHQSLEGKQDKITTTNKLSVDLVSGLATIATSGSYNDLTDKPLIDNNNQTIKVGTTTFDANDVVEIKGSTNVSVAADKTTKTITITGKSDDAINTLITNKINDLDGVITGTAGQGKTLTALTQTNGKVSATFSDISITASQVSDFNTKVDARIGNHSGVDKTGTVTSVSAGTGLKITGTASVAPKVEINNYDKDTNPDGVVFVFNCGSATELVD